MAQVDTVGDRNRTAPIGVFGGTFDPPHIGHLVAALQVRETLGLDKVLLVVANRPWQKVGTRPVTSAETRLAMVRAAVEGLEGLEASDLEIRRGGDSYTADTLAELRSQAPGAELLVILGADAAALVDTWERADEVLETATIVAYDRFNGRADVESIDDFGSDVRRVRVPRLEVSSTDLRARVAAGRRLDVLCPPEVIRIITEQGLYRVGDP